MATWEQRSEKTTRNRKLIALCLICNCDTNQANRSYNTFHDSSGRVRPKGLVKRLETELGSKAVTWHATLCCAVCQRHLKRVEGGKRDILEFHMKYQQTRQQQQALSGKPTDVKIEDLIRRVRELLQILQSPVMGDSMAFRVLSRLTELLEVSVKHFIPGSNLARILVKLGNIEEEKSLGDILKAIWQIDPKLGQVRSTSTAKPGQVRSASATKTGATEKTGSASDPLQSTRENCEATGENTKSNATYSMHDNTPTQDSQAPNCHEMADVDNDLPATAYPITATNLLGTDCQDKYVHEMNEEPNHKDVDLKRTVSRHVEESDLNKKNRECGDIDTTDTDSRTCTMLDDSECYADLHGGLILKVEEIKMETNDFDLPKGSPITQICDLVNNIPVNEENTCVENTESIYSNNKNSVPCGYLSGLPDHSTNMELFTLVQNNPVVLRRIDTAPRLGRDTSAHQPDITCDQPGTTCDQPGTTCDQPGTSRDQPGTIRDQPGTPCDQPGTSRDQPGTTRDQPGTTRDQPGTTRDQPGTTSDQPGTTSDQPATTCDMPATTCDQPGTTCDQPATTCDLPATTCDTPATTCDTPGTSCNQPGTTRDQPGSTRDQPGTTRDQPGTTRDQPANTATGILTSSDSEEEPEMTSDLRSSLSYLKYHCFLCFPTKSNIPFESQTALDNHMYTKHVVGGKNQRKLECPVCNIKLTYKVISEKFVKDSCSQLLLHLVSKHKWKTPDYILAQKCIYTADCKFIALTSAQMKKHRRTQHVSVLCALCGSSQRPDLLKKPLRKCSGNVDNVDKKAVEKEQCPVCKKLVRKQHLKLHTERHEQIICYVCSKLMGQYELEWHLFRRHGINSNNRRTLHCASCDYQTILGRDLRDHTKRYHEKRLVRCPTCHKMLSEMSLDVHIRTVHCERKFSCSQCAYKAKTRTNLSLHMFKHSGMKDHACDWCPYKAATKAILRSHQKRCRHRPQIKT